MDELLRGVKAFSSLTDDELAVIGESAVETVFEEGEELFRSGDTDRALHALLEGAVEMRLPVSEGIDKTIATARPGMVLGLLTFFDGGESPASAVAIAKTRVVSIDRGAFDQFAERHPAAAERLLVSLAVGLATAMRILSDEMRRIVRWSLEISGASQLGISRLITDETEIGVDLVNGQSFRGIMLSAETGGSAPAYFFRTSEGDLRFVPHHALAQATFGSGVLQASPEATEEI